MPYTGWLDDPSEPLNEYGGKGSSLAALRAAGFNVPPGFCVKASGYRRFIAANALAGPIATLLTGGDLTRSGVAREAGGALTAQLQSASLPDDLSDDIRSAYRQLGLRPGGLDNVAVRSSALSEDAAGASSAGLYETYLNLRDDAAVIDATLRCYRSLWTPRAVQYRAMRGIDSSREAMAVVVMRMVSAEVSGVAFTVNPVTGDPGQIIINASWGLGEAIVSGRVTPDQFTIDKSTMTVTERHINSKDIEVQPDTTGRSGTVELPVAPARASAPTLGDDTLRELSMLCRRIDLRYGRPMDIEWAISGGQIFILQARPVTGLR